MSEPRRRGLGAFGAGVIVGLLSPIAAAVVFHFALGATAPQLRPPSFNVLVESQGADVSRHAGAKVIVSHEHGVIEQICRDGCDDLRVEAASGENVFRVSVLDADGKCIACDAGQYVDSGYGAPITRWKVSGPEVLGVQVGFLSRRADGSRTEDPATAIPQHP